MFKGLYDWLIRKAESPRAPAWLAAVAFAESSFFPLPPDMLLLPMAVARPKSAWTYAAITTTASVLGGMLGYALGALLYDTIGQWLIHLYGYEGKMAGMREAYAKYGAWLILIKGVLPIPYKLVTIASGLMGYDFFAFVALSALTRGVRFFAEAGLFQWFAAPLKALLERHFALIIVAFLLTIVVGFVVATRLI